jgi:hypothetical protein
MNRLKRDLIRSVVCTAVFAKTRSPIENAQGTAAKVAESQRRFFFAACVLPLVLICAGCGSSSSPSIPPPQTSEFIYVGSQGVNSAANPLPGTISAFQINGSGQLSEIPGSPFKVPLLPPFGWWGLQADPKSRFLMVVSATNTLMPAGISASHTLTFGSGAKLLPGGTLMDPRGRFFFDATDGSGSLGPTTPIHVYSVTADLSFPEVLGSPFLAGILPAAIDPEGKFIFGIGGQIDTLQISASGALTKTSSFPDYAAYYAFIHPSGQFLYAEDVSQTNPDGTDIQVYKIDSVGGLTPAASEPNFAPGKTFSFYFHPSGNFLFSNGCTNLNSTCSLDTLPIDVNTGRINPTATSSLPGRFASLALDSTGGRLFVIANGSDCTVPGLLSVYSVSTQGELRATGVTAQTGPCPTSVVVTQ